MEVAVQANEPLLLTLAVRVLHDGGKQLQPVALTERRAAAARVDLVEFRPAPARSISVFDLVPLHLPFDGGDLDLLYGVF